MYHAAPGRIRFNGNPTLLSSNYVTLLCATLPYARRRFYERSPRLPPPFEKHETQLVRDLYVENYFEGSVLCISTYIYSRLQILEKKSVKLLNYSQQGKRKKSGKDGKEKIVNKLAWAELYVVKLYMKREGSSACKRAYNRRA